MALIRLYMTMSLDGYVTGPRDSPDTPLGIVIRSGPFFWLQVSSGPVFSRAGDFSHGVESGVIKRLPHGE